MNNKELDLKLGYSCNNNCIHCVIADNRKFAKEKIGRFNRTTSECKKELSDSRKNDYSQVIITGGEPTIRKDLIEILSYAKSLGYFIHMQTNGRMFYDKEYTKLLTKFNISYTIALHGNNETIHDQITRVPSSFKQTIKGIENLIYFNQIVAGKVVISKYNYKNLVDIYKLFSKLNVKHINMAFPHALGNARKFFNCVVPRYKSIQPYLNHLIEIKKDRKTNFEFETIPYCILYNPEGLSSEDRKKGVVTECKQVGDKPVNWSNLRKENKIKFQKCELCKWNSACEGPWKEYVDSYGDEEFEPVLIKNIKP
jgi:MoaA/NifB/PqqE/SkfB family radical SAM enzyme